MFGSTYGGGGIENSAPPSDDHVVPTANNCRGLTGPTTMMIPINNKGTGGGSNALAFNGKFNQTNTTNNSHRVLGKRNIVLSLQDNSTFSIIISSNNNSLTK